MEPDLWSQETQIWSDLGVAFEGRWEDEFPFPQ